VPGTSEWIEGIPFFVFYGFAFPCESITWIGRILLSQITVLYLIVILRLNENRLQTPICGKGEDYAKRLFLFYIDKLKTLDIK
jgi:hypothetical protein